MPKDNNQTPTPGSSPVNNSVPPVMFSDDIAPPMPQQIPPVPTVTDTKPEVKTDITNPSPASSTGSAAPANDVIDSVMPAVVTNSNKKKFAGGKIIATILGLFLLVGGVGAGVYLTSQNQDIRELAGTLVTPTEQQGTPVTCSTDADCGSDYTGCSNGICVGGTGCFLPGTLVNNASSSLRIENVKVGDTVSSFDENGKVIQSTVSNIYEVTRPYYFSLSTIDTNVKVTAEHPFYIGNNEYKEASEIKAGDVVYLLKNNSLVKSTVVSNIKIDEPTVAYNLTVDNTHTFFANNFAVHNKLPSTLAQCGGGGLDCSLSNIGGSNACLSGGQQAYCCPAGQHIQGGSCVGYASCGNNLDCSFGVLGGSSACNSGGDTLYCCPSGQHNQNGTCVGGAANPCGSGLSCGEFGVNGAGSCTGNQVGNPNAQIYCCPAGQNYTYQGCVSDQQQQANCLPPSELVTGTNGQTVCIPPGNCQHHTGNCYVTNGIGANDQNDGTTPGSYVCDDNGHFTTCEQGYVCDVAGQDCVPMATTPPGGGNPTPPGTTAICQNIKAYSPEWVMLLPNNLSTLQAGDQVNFCATGAATTGSFNKARFTINGVLQAETSTVRPGGNDFCQLYTVPAGTTSFTIGAEVNHTTLGWR